MVLGREYNGGERLKPEMPQMYFRNPKILPGKSQIYLQKSTSSREPINDGWGADCGRYGYCLWVPLDSYRRSKVPPSASQSIL